MKSCKLKLHYLKVVSGSLQDCNLQTVCCALVYNRSKWQFWVCKWSLIFNQSRNFQWSHYFPKPPLHLGLGSMSSWLIFSNSFGVFAIIDKAWTEAWSSSLRIELTVLKQMFLRVDIPALLWLTTCTVVQ